MSDPSVVIAEATARHHLDPNRTDADRHSFCICGRWADGEMEPGWDEHLADVAVEALQAAGLLLLSGGETETQWAVIGEDAGGPYVEYGEDETDARRRLRIYAEDPTARLASRTIHTGPWQVQP